MRNIPELCLISLNHFDYYFDDEGGLFELFNRLSFAIVITHQERKLLQDYLIDNRPFISRIFNTKFYWKVGRTKVRKKWLKKQLYKLNH